MVVGYIASFSILSMIICPILEAVGADGGWGIVVALILPLIFFPITIGVGLVVTVIVVIVIIVAIFVSLLFGPSAGEAVIGGVTYLLIPK